MTFAGTNASRIGFQCNSSLKLCNGFSRAFEASQYQTSLTMKRRRSWFYANGLLISEECKLTTSQAAKNMTFVVMGISKLRIQLDGFVIEGQGLTKMSAFSKRICRTVVG